MSGQKTPGLIGYVAPLSAAPGGALAFKISSLGNRPVAARAVRLICCDPNPAGPGIKIEEADFGLAERYPASEQRTYLGSCAFGDIPELSDRTAVKVEVMVKPTFHSDFAQTLFSLQNADGTAGVAVDIRGSMLFLQQLGTDHVFDVGVGLAKGHWSRLAVAFDPDGFSVTVSRDLHRGGDAKHVNLSHVTSRALAGADHICFAAVWRGHPEQTFNGSLEGPLLSVKGSAEEPAWEVIAAWNFGGDARDTWVEDEKERGAAAFPDQHADPRDQIVGMVRPETGLETGSP
ncbi:hypothetical protein [Ensifer canadensis]